MPKRNVLNRETTFADGLDHERLDRLFEASWLCIERFVRSGGRWAYRSSEDESCNYLRIVTRIVLEKRPRIPLHKIIGAFFRQFTAGMEYERNAQRFTISI